MIFYRISMLLFIALGLGQGLRAQDDAAPRHALGLEIGGAGLTYSLFYEYQARPRWLLRAGASYLNVSERQTERQLHLASFPIGAAYLLPLRGQAQQLELSFGLGNLVSTGDLVETRGVSDWFLNPQLGLGYRLAAKEDSPWLFRAQVLGIWGTRSLGAESRAAFSLLGSNLLPWLGLSAAYRF